MTATQATRAMRRSKQCHILAVVLTIVSLALYAAGGRQAIRGEVLPCLVLFALGAAAQIQALRTAKAGERWAALNAG